MDTAIQRTAPQIRTVSYTQSQGTQSPSAWQALSAKTGASQASLQVFATAYQNTAQSGRLAHSIFARLAK
jgi:hypothetical protein